MSQLNIITWYHFKMYFILINSDTDCLLHWCRVWSFFQLVEKAHLQFFSTPPLYVNSLSAYPIGFWFAIICDWLILFRLALEPFYSNMFLDWYVCYWLRSDFQQICTILYVSFLIFDSCDFSALHWWDLDYRNDHKATISLSQWNTC